MKADRIVQIFLKSWKIWAIAIIIYKISISTLVNKISLEYDFIVYEIRVRFPERIFLHVSKSQYLFSNLNYKFQKVL